MSLVSGLELFHAAYVTPLARGLLISVVCAFALPIIPVRAASFDCSHASTRRERTVCRAPLLSTADDRVAALYRRDVSKLSEAGAAAIRDDQRAWLKSLDLLCRRRDSDESGYEACLSYQYGEREASLENAVSRSGRATLYYVDRAVLGHYDYFGPDRLYESYVVHYPQIDQPDAAERAWNRKVANVPDAHLSCRGDSRVVQMYSVGVRLFVPGLIWTGTLSYRFRCPSDPASQPPVDRATDVTVLHPWPHAAAAEDILIPESGWNLFLERAAITGLRKEAAVNGCDPARLPIDEVKAAIRDPSKWSFFYGVHFVRRKAYHDGLQGMYITAAQRVEGCKRGPGFVDTGIIPWRDIKRYVRPQIAMALEAKRDW